MQDSNQNGGTAPEPTLAEKISANKQRIEAEQRVEAERLTLKKFAESGITDPELILASAEPQSKTQTFEAVYHKVLSYRERRYHFDGSEIIQPEDDRYRLLELVPDLDKEGRQKFDHLGNPRTKRYSMRKGARMWAAWSPDPRRRLREVTSKTPTFILTEGARKGLAGEEAFDLPALALQGVWCFSNKKHSERLIDEIKELFVRCKHPPTLLIIFDNDQNSSNDIKMAIAALQRELSKIGRCTIKNVLLPPGPAKGLDDWILAGGTREAFDKLVEESEEYGAAKDFWRTNEEYGYLRDSGNILRHDDKKVIRFDHFVRDVGPRARTGRKSHASEWVERPMRTEWKRIVYLPGTSGLVPDGTFIPGIEGDAGGSFSVYQDDGCKAKPGDIRPIIWLLQHVVPERSNRLDLVGAWAHLVQHPEQKMQRGWVLTGKEGGSGKTTVGHIIPRKLFGESNVSKIGNSELKSEWNEWLAGKLWVALEETKGGDARQSYNDLKDTISADSIRINIKCGVRYTTNNTAHACAISNELDPVGFEEGDRRCMASRAGSKLPDGVVLTIRRYIEQYGGGEAFKHYLKNYRLGPDVAKGLLTRFDPLSDAPRSKAKDASAARVRGKGFKELVCELKRDEQRPTYTTFDLIKIMAERYTGQKPTKGEITALANALEDGGFVCVGRGRPDATKRSYTPMIWRLREVPEEMPMQRILCELRDSWDRQSDFFGADLFDPMLVTATNPDLESWATRLAANPELTLGDGAIGFEHRDLWTTTDLVEVCDIGRKPTLREMSNALAAAGIGRTRPLIGSLKGVPLWVVNNADYWLSKPLHVVAAGYKTKLKAPKF